MTVFFLFLPRKSSEAAERLDVCAREKVRALDRSPSSARCSGFPRRLLLILTAIALSPRPADHFRRRARIRWQPKRSDAGYALKTIMEKMPSRWEPVIGIVKAADAQQLHDYWQKVAAQWNELQVAGKIKSFSTPAALALSPHDCRQIGKNCRRSILRPRARRLKPRSPPKDSAVKPSLPPSSCSIN